MQIKQELEIQQITMLISTIILTILIFLTLFVRPMVGLADNGDFFREIHNLGLYHFSDIFEEKHFGYFDRLYGISRYPIEQNTAFISSLSIPIKAAIAVDKFLTRDFVFDIRVLATFYSIAFIFAFYSLLKDLSKGIKLPVVIIAVVAIIVFGDVGYISYFNSFYGEPLMYVFFFLMLAFIFRMLKKNGPAISDFILFSLCALIFVGAKQQNSPIGLLIVMLCIRLLFLRKDKLWRAVVASSIVAIVVISGFVYSSISDDIKYINQYHALTRGILHNSKDVEKDIEELGLDWKYSMLAGTTYFGQYSIEDLESELMNEEFHTKYGFGMIIRYYLVNFDRLIEKCDEAASNGFSIRPKVMGNYEKVEGMAYGEKASMFSLWSTAKEVIFPKNFKFIVFFYAFYYGTLLKLYIDRFRNKDESERETIKLEIFAMVGLIGLMVLGVSFVGAGDADLAKHLFLFNVCFDFMFVCVFVFTANMAYIWLGFGERIGGPVWRGKSSISG